MEKLIEKLMQKKEKQRKRQNDKLITFLNKYLVVDITSLNLIFA